MAITTHVINLDQKYAQFYIGPKRSLLRGWVHQFFSYMHEFFPHKLHCVTGIFLSTLDHGLITSRRILRSTTCFVGYTLYYHILRNFRNVFYFYTVITRRLPGAACSQAPQSFYYWQRNDISILLLDALIPPSTRIKLELF